MTVTVRFASRPAGRLHLGDVRTAVINFLFARKHGGRFLLRLDDAGGERAGKKSARAIEADMAWLGLDWDLFARQSDRLALYTGAAERLKAAGRLYPCFETAVELLEATRRDAEARKQPAIYDRAALTLSPDDVAERIAGGAAPHWRFKLDADPIVWEDLIQGRVEVESAALSDPVLLHADNTPLETFASVVDDVEFEITQVISENPIAETAVQLQIWAALGFPPPAFAHLPRLASPKGKASAKRLETPTLAALRDAGIEPMAINSLLAKLGTTDPVEPRLQLDQLAVELDLAKFGRAPPSFDPADLPRLNAGLLRLMPHQAVAHRLPEGAGRDFWEAVRPNLARFADVAHWWQVCRGPLAPEITPADAAFLTQAAALLPAGPLDHASWDKWVAALEGPSGRKGEVLLRPLRRALAAREDADDLRALLPLIGRERVVRRLEGETA